jgi:hypothetical protein
VAVLDANQDGRFDLVYGNWEGQHRLMVQQGDGRFSDQAPHSMATPSRVRTVLVADFDNDGYEEIFFNNMGQTNRLFGQRNGLWMQLPIGDAAEGGGLGTGAVVGDFDNDGRLELIVMHGEIGLQPLSYYRTRPNANGWARILPLTRAGAPARGAVVRLWNGERGQLRAIDAGSGYLCQMEPVAHFGLGPHWSKHLRAEIRWPDGAQTTLNDIAPMTTTIVSHP